MMTDRPFRFGVVAAQAPWGDAWLATARRVEELGYATLLTPDRLGPLLSPMPALAAAAAATHTLRLGTYVLAAGWRNPALLAQECATLDLLSGGRFELGLGSGVGGEDARQAGLPDDPPGARVDRLAETLDALKALLRPRPPILVAAGGRRALALAAREADIVSLGVRPHGGEAALAEATGWLRNAAGERFPSLELSLTLLAVVGDAPPAPQLRGRLRGMFGLDLDDLVRAKSPFVAAGGVDEMCAQLLERRERLGISYVTVPADLMDALAPVVARLSGR
jgi:probable F420-dependent oxidoreductase